MCDYQHYRKRRLAQSGKLLVRTPMTQTECWWMWKSGFGYGLAI